MPETTEIIKPPLAFTEADLARAHEEWGCSCGPAALAALLGLGLEQIRPHLGYFEVKRHMNTNDALATIRSFGLRADSKWLASRDGNEFQSVHPTDLDNALVRVQWGGSWLRKGVPPGAAAAKTHWVATRFHPDDIRSGRPWIYDVNAGWLPRADWEGDVVPRILATIKGADGRWFFANAVRVEKGVARG